MMSVRLSIKANFASPMTVSNVWSLETTQDMKASSPSVFYDSTSSTDDANISCSLLQSVSLNANLFKNPMVRNRFSASHRYIPNEHHRIVANVSLNSSGNWEPRSEGKIGCKAPRLRPSSSQHTSINQHSRNQMPSEQYTECQNSQISCQNGDKEEEQLRQKRQKCEGSLPLLLTPYEAYNQFDQHQSLQSDQSQKRHVLAGNMGFAQLHPHNAIGSHLMKSGNLLEQMPSEPLVGHDIIKPEQPPLPEEYARFQSSGYKEDSYNGNVIIPTKTEPYQAIHNVLLLYEHVNSCQDESKDCKFFQCTNFKRTLSHVLQCKDSNCTKRCFKFKSLFDHYRECSKSSCSICGPIRTRTEVSQRENSNAFTELRTSCPTVSSLNHEGTALKHAKDTHHFVQDEIYEASSQITSCNHLSGDMQVEQEVCMPVGTNTGNGKPVKTYMPVGESADDCGKPMERKDVCSIFRNCSEIYDSKFDHPEIRIKEDKSVEPIEMTKTAIYSEQKNVIQEETNGECNTNLPAAADITETEIGSSKRIISLNDSFTMEKLREHIKSLEQHINQDKTNTHKSQGAENLLDQNSCSLCKMEKLTFEVPPRYCSSCFKQINPKGVYYTMASYHSAKYDCCVKTSFCGKCYGTSGEIIKVGQQEIWKAHLERKLNYGEADVETEWWVQCDKCKAWQHQICALFNSKRKEALQAEYICPNCYLEELGDGKHAPQKNAVLGANDLPKTMLSDHIEKRLFERLNQDREERARILEKSVDEVPGPEGLFIRVVSSVDKKLDVNPVFHEAFKDKMYPTHFPYKSKVILLFQKIEGADVCLFGMYVQEYGSECPFPNRRRVCISYIDSVKYFRPEVKAATGEALRTFVYHEILIAYLDYCKKRGFTSCYIWACPSLRQDYYILYCHPKMQKTPKSDKLREWYQVMIRKAMKEKIILEQTNLYDHFFVLTSESKANISAASLPYFDSDFWPGKAEILLNEDKNESQAKGTKAAVQRALRAAKRDALTGNPNDILLMHQLGEIIRPIKEDFIMVHFQHTCKYCYQPIVHGNQWICNACKNFQLCEQCYNKMQNLETKDRHPATAKEKHSFQLVESGILADTGDKDEIMRSKLFDVRTGFLSFCQNEQYQFDSLRRAKHSSMMILYHLHNPSAPVFAFSCSRCHSDIDSGQNWLCLICQGYHLCDSCYHQKGVSPHMHHLVRDATTADRTLQPKHQRDGKLNIQVALDALLHAPQCGAPRCAYACCLKVKKLFLHSRNCKVRVHGGCIPCKKIWLLLQRHAYTCQESNCPVPRCKDLKDYMGMTRQEGSKGKNLAAKLGFLNGGVQNFDLIEKFQLPSVC